MNHPYPIVRYGMEVAMQIGTLIVVEESSGEDGGYAIETHSHPVVSYINRERGKILVSRDILPESVVWNKVEANQVEYLCLENEEELAWKRFAYFIWCGISEAIMSGEDPNYSYGFKLWERFRNLGIPVQPILPGLYEIDLTLDDNDGALKVCIGDAVKLTEMDGHITEGHDLYGVFPLGVIDNGDEDKMLKAITTQLRAFRHMDIGDIHARFHFTSSDGNYKHLAERLNGKNG